ncbi:MAG: hypothetical protein WCG55_04080 [bacterium]
MNKKKISVGLIVLSLAVLTIPQVTFASWWNPFSWSIFHKKSVATQTVPTIPSSSQTTATKPLSDDYSVLAKRYGGNQTQAQKVVPVTVSAVTEPEDITAYRKQTDSAYADEINKFNIALVVESVPKNFIDSKISELNDDITQGQGFKLGNPNSAEAVDYMATVYNNQLEFEKKYFDAEASIIKWIQDSKNNMEASKSKLSTLNTKEQIDNEVQKIKFYDDNLAQAQNSSKKWSDTSHSTQVKIDGIIAGLSSYYSSGVASNNAPSINVTYPQTFLPTSFNCTSSKDVLGGVQTQCY